MNFLSLIKPAQAIVKVMSKLSWLLVVRVSVIIIQRMFFIIERQSDIVNKKNNLLQANKSVILSKSKKNLEYM